MFDVIINKNKKRNRLQNYKKNSSMKAENVLDVIVKKNLRLFCYFKKLIFKYVRDERPQTLFSEYNNFNILGIEPVIVSSAHLLCLSIVI